MANPTAAFTVGTSSTLLVDVTLILESLELEILKFS